MKNSRQFHKNQPNVQFIHQTNLYLLYINNSTEFMQKEQLKEEKEVDDEHPQVNSTSKIANFSFISK